MTDLQKHILLNPQHKEVFFNAAGEHLFFSHPNYPIVKTRGEVLEPENSDDSETTKGEGSKAKKKTAGELIDLINAAETSEAATLAAEGDERATVVKALEAKLLTFETN